MTRKHIEELREVLEESEIILDEFLYRILFNAELSVESRNEFLSTVEYVKTRMKEGLEIGNQVF
jgi:hypothetical protein